MTYEQLKLFLTEADATVVEAMQKIDTNAKGILFIVDHQGKIAGVVTDGDIRRWLIAITHEPAEAKQARSFVNGEGSSFEMNNGICALSERCQKQRFVPFRGALRFRRQMTRPGN